MPTSSLAWASDPPHNQPGIHPRIEQPRKPSQRRVAVRTPQGFAKGAEHVVVETLVAAEHGLLDAFLRHGQSPHGSSRPPPAGVVSTANSSAPRAIRTSPLATCAIWRMASGAMSHRQLAKAARRVRQGAAHGAHDIRLRQGDKTERPGTGSQSPASWPTMGFSVVEPMKRMVPPSMAGRMLSLCALLQRWHSSSSRYVAWPVEHTAFLAPPCSTSRTSATPLVTAFSCTKAALVCPGNDGSQRGLSTSWRPAEDGAKSAGPPQWRGATAGLPPPDAVWPINSSRVRGRMRSARGAWFCSGIRVTVFPPSYRPSCCQAHRPTSTTCTRSSAGKPRRKRRCLVL